jgi:autotransporter-associated beta strand protein
LGIASALPSGSGKGNMILNGTLNLAGFSNTVNGLSGSGTVTNSSATAATLTAGAADQSSTFSGNIQNGTGNVGLTKTGTGTLTLSGNNSFSGTTNISAGTLAMGSSTGLSGNSTLTIASSGFLDVNGFNITIDGLLGTGTINNNGTSPSILNTGAGNTSTQFDGVIADGTNTTALTKSGSGTLTLTGVNTYSGTTTISNGTVSVANAGSGGNLGTATSVVILGDSSNKGTLSYTGNTDLLYTRGFDVGAGGGQVNIATSGRNLTLQTGAITTAGTFTVGGSGNVILNSIISGSGGFTKANTGTLIANSANTYSGDTLISTGVFQLANAAAIPSGTGKGNVTVNGTLDLNNLTVTINGLSGSGTVTNSQGSPINLTVGGNNASGNYSGVLQDGAGFLSLIKTGTGTQTISGANTYSGDTTISAGILKIGNASALPSSTYKGNVNLSAAGTLDLNNFNQTINGLTGSGLVTNNSGNSILTVGANDQTAAFTGNIQDGLGTIGLTKTGIGSLTLSGNNTFSGATNISTGTVTLGSNTALSAASTLTIGNAGALDLNGRVIAIDGLAGTGSLTNNSATAVTLTTGSSGGSGTFGGTINDGVGTIALTKTGSGTVTLTNANSYSGGTTVTGGLLAITADSSLGALPGSTTPGNIILNGGGISSINTFTLDSKRGITIGPSNGSGFGALDAAINQTLTYGGIIANNGAGTGSLYKTGAGTLTLTNANTYSGDTLISTGALQIGNAAAIPSGSGKGNVGIDGTLDLNGFNIAVNGVNGSGTISSTNSGNASISIGNNDQTSTFAGTITNGIGTVSLGKNGTGVLTLAGANTFTGGTTNNSGVISLASAGALGSVGEIRMNGGTLQFTAANQTDYSSRLKFEDGKTATFDTNGQDVTFATAVALGAGQTGSMEKIGSGTLSINASNGYTGATSVSCGTLLVNGSLGASQTSVASGANLGGTGVLAGDVTANGTVAPGLTNAIGTLGLNRLNLFNTLSIQWDGVSDTTDVININGLLELQGSSKISFSSLGGVLTKQAYVFGTYGSLSNNLNAFGTIENLPTGYAINYSYGASMNQLALVAVPETHTALLSAIGTLILATRRRNRQTAA